MDSERDAARAHIIRVFTDKFGHWKQGAEKMSKVRSSLKNKLATMRKMRNMARNDLRRARRQGNKAADKPPLAAAFHKYLREYRKVIGC